MPTLLRREFLMSASAAALSSSLSAKEASASQHVFIGGTAKGEGEGIHVARWDAGTGTLSNLHLGVAVNQPSFMIACEERGQRFLFSGHQPSPTEASLSSFRVTPTGELQEVNTIKVPDEEESFIQIALDRTNRCLVSASYRTSKVRSFKVSADGHLSGPMSEFQLSGSGPNAKRQTTAHAHGAVVSPDNRHVLINDLGSDRIMVYKLDTATAEMKPNDPPFFSAAPGSGPRHTAFHPNGKWAYSINELDSTLTLMNWDAAKGILTKVESFPTLPPDADVSKNRAGEVIIDESGRFLYSCNRGPSDELLAYSIAPNGHLSLLQRTPLGGKEARHYAIDPSGRFVVVAEQASDRVGVFSRNTTSGELEATGKTYPANKASCVVFA
jgi:6-phosphogluconolactonase